MRGSTGVSEADFAAALTQFEAAVGKQWVFTSDEDVDLYRDSFSPFWHEAEIRPVRGSRARRSRAGAGGRQDRQHVQDSAVDDLDRQESSLRRFGAPVVGKRGPGPEAHESDS